MAYTPRTIAVIQNQITQEKANESALSGLTSTSPVAYWTLWTFLQAVAISLMENIWSILQTEIEATVSKGIPGTAPWIQNEVLKFQYSVATPQVVQINSDFSIGYPVVDPALCIVSHCAVVPSSSGVISVKVATGTTPAPISSPQQTALNSFLNTILPSGAVFQIINSNADTLRIDAVVYFNGQYSGVIQTSVESALTNYMNNLQFNGAVKISDITKVILNVPGVTDVTFSRITATTAGGSAVNLILGSTEMVRTYQTFSGYVVNDPAHTFSSTITYTVSDN